jgi:hypothetical protein
MNARHSLAFASPASADVTQQLLHSAEPSLRLQVVSDLLSQRPDSRDVRQLAEYVRMSSRVAMLLSEPRSPLALPMNIRRLWSRVCSTNGSMYARSKCCSRAPNRDR